MEDTRLALSDLLEKKTKSDYPWLQGKEVDQLDPDLLYMRLIGLIQIVLIYIIAYTLQRRMLQSHMRLIDFLDL